MGRPTPRPGHCLLPYTGPGKPFDDHKCRSHEQVTLYSTQTGSNSKGTVGGPPICLAPPPTPTGADEREEVPLLHFSVHVLDCSFWGVFMELALGKGACVTQGTVGHFSQYLG